ncbi:uncharacterized protein BDR25DRAFT_353286 [Lindgomyces ingoldianus]|uniref:Uncharacterized protein n=1 Tax=Lindgomyces ingoldianus TaxID=673940 RepID=A0ACB6R159_9PLEO|nr:uncharacterized protein BDR25DRAFT_353286 [Lindgomyces ingoldianus]KAF2472979.1 hypothetical protein BDR25DRAFT_353286 [Lindgomyces ingoldianus]
MIRTAYTTLKAASSYSAPCTGDSKDGQERRLDFQYSAGCLLTYEDMGCVGENGEWLTKLESNNERLNRVGYSVPCLDSHFSKVSKYLALLPSLGFILMIYNSIQLGFKVEPWGWLGADTPPSLGQAATFAPMTENLNHLMKMEDKRIIMHVFSVCAAVKLNCPMNPVNFRETYSFATVGQDTDLTSTSASHPSSFSRKRSKESTAPQGSHKHFPSLLKELSCAYSSLSYGYARLFTKDAAGKLIRDFEKLSVSLGPERKAFWAMDDRNFIWDSLPAELETGVIEVLKNGKFIDSPRVVTLGFGGDYFMLMEKNSRHWHLADYRELNAAMATFRDNKVFYTALTRPSTESRLEPA